MRREYDLKLAEVEARLRAVAPATTPHADMGQIIAAISATVTPILTAMVQASSDSRRDSQAMLATLLSRPAVPPEVASAMDRLATAALAPRDDGSAAAKLTASMGEAIGSMSNTMLNVLHTVSEMNTPTEPAEPGWVKAVREVVRGLASMMQVQATAAQAAVASHGAQRASPPAVRQPALPAGPAPAVAPTSPPAARQRRAALDVILDGVTRQAPAAQVATAFVNALKRGDPSVVQALAAHDGDVEALARVRLGPWVAADADKRLPYLKAVMDALDAKARAAGLVDDAVGDAPPVAAAPAAPVAVPSPQAGAAMATQPPQAAPPLDEVDDATSSDDDDAESSDDDAGTPV